MGEDDVIEALKALAHPLRWRILTALADGPRNVGEIEQATQIGQPGLSQQLGVLRKAGLVTTRRQAKLVYYATAGDGIAQVAQALAQITPAPAAADAQASGQTSRQPKAAPGVANFARLP